MVNQALADRQSLRLHTHDMRVKNKDQRRFVVDGLLNGCEPLLQCLFR